MLNNYYKYRVPIAIFIVWLFHVSALIGITMGHIDWFIKKTPLNLSLCLLLFILTYPLHQIKHGIAFFIFFISGMLAEWIGVHYGLLFGDYEYGNNFGPKLDSIPLLIGTYWALLTFITASISDYLNIKNTFKILIGAFLMVLLDFFMEHSAPTFDFWTFEGGAPLNNYITWFIIALLFQLLLRSFKISGNKSFSLQLYLAQLVFFAYFFF